MRPEPVKMLYTTNPFSVGWAMRSIGATRKLPANTGMYSLKRSVPHTAGDDENKILSYIYGVTYPTRAKIGLDET
jgi:hypothetical protein